VRRYQRVATGGTFDQLHRGHISLLKRSFEVGDEVVIGVTSDELARKMGKEPTLMYRERVRRLRAFLKKSFPGRRYIVAKLFDYFGPGIASADVQALVASEETASRINIANKIREERGFPPLKLVVVDLVMADDAKPISSTRIKRGEIDVEGRLLKPRTPRGREEL